MANPKWIKWAVGLSSVALFAGFVGYISDEGTSGAASSVPSAAFSDSSRPDSSSSGEWTSNGNDNFGGNSSDMLPGGGRSGGGFGRMRTRGS
ncbi:hypothetical protein [Cohnella sp. REN36]|uniref:hypothetical protein n=1 Tax=Cohnella sp. REN36 TaxID=2887347 RepID=UPI001D15BD41|nr:hypothetical protein [Cohnella sp. REN36]MCC3373917.1 hypothetical protein [Cohnella sp. REN36]